MARSVTASPYQAWNPLGTIGTGTLLTVQLDWPPGIVDRLTGEAQKKGLSLDAYILEVVQKNASNGLPIDDAEKRRMREQAAASIRELRKETFSAQISPSATLLKKDAGSEFLRSGY